MYLIRPKAYCWIARYKFGVCILWIALHSTSCSALREAFDLSLCCKSMYSPGGRASCTRGSSNRRKHMLDYGSPAATFTAVSNIRQPEAQNIALLQGYTSRRALTTRSPALEFGCRPWNTGTRELPPPRAGYMLPLLPAKAPTHTRGTNSTRMATATINHVPQRRRHLELGETLLLSDALMATMSAAVEALPVCCCV